MTQKESCPGEHKSRKRQKLIREVIFMSGHNKKVSERSEVENPGKGENKKRSRLDRSGSRNIREDNCWKKQKEGGGGWWE